MDTEFLIAEFMGAEIVAIPSHNSPQMGDPYKDKSGEVLSYVTNPGYRVARFRDGESPYGMNAVCTLEQRKLKYGTSMDWLARVVERIRLSQGTYGILTIYGLSKARMDCYVDGVRVKTITTKGVRMTETVHAAVVSYIRWYNENNLV
jgi:hypothetical protein